MPFLNTFHYITAVFMAIALYFAFNDPALNLARNREAIRRNPSVFTPPASQCTQTGRIALTFNQGVSLTNTPAVMNVLKSANTSATFFVSTEWVGREQLVDALLRRMLAEGHIVGFHWFGGDPRELNESDLRAQLISQSTKIFTAAGVNPRFMRFPYDQMNQQVIKVANDLGLVLSSWNIDPSDYQLCPNFPRIYDYTTTNVTAAYLNQFKLFKDAGNLQSSFIGLHTDLCPIAPAVGNLISLAKQYQYELVDIAKCLGQVSSYRKASDSAEPIVPGNSGGSLTTSSIPVTVPTNVQQSNNSPVQSSALQIRPFSSVGHILVFSVVILWGLFGN